MAPLTYGQQVLGMAESGSVRLLSYYSIGALISVLVLAVLLSKVLRPVTVILVYPMITLIAVLTLLFVKVPAIAIAAAFFMGFFYGWGLSISDYCYDRAFLEQKRNGYWNCSDGCWISYYFIAFLATGLMSKTDIFQLSLFLMRCFQ